MALTTANELELRAVAERLEKAGVKFTSIVECEGEHAGQLMAIGLKPVPREEVWRQLSALPLLK